MGFFNRRPSKLGDEQLRDALFNAATESNTQELKKLLARHMERVVALFPTWTTVPSSVRSDVSRTTWWAEGLIGVASAAATLGEASLIAQLQGPSQENPIIRWQDCVLAAQADASKGDYSSAIRRLDRILEEVDGLTGSGVDQLLPKTYGLLGALHHQAGNHDQAHDFTFKAKEHCERTGDREGAEIYTRNLKIIDAG